MEVGLALSFNVFVLSVLVELALILEENPSLSLDEDIIGFLSACTAEILIHKHEIKIQNFKTHIRSSSPSLCTFSVCSTGICYGGIL